MAPLQGGLVAAEGAAGGQARACLPAEPGSRPAVGDIFAQEAQIPDVHDLKAPYIEMHKILEQVGMRPA
eukprot:1150199-Pelagomonas_calceolata.AAC.9